MASPYVGFLRACRRFFLVALLLSVLSAPPPARACGVFVRDPEKHPSVAHEQVLLMHDAARGRQHFVRKVAFRDTDEPFGFVVPVPARPEVAPVQMSPFGALRRSFHFGVPVRPIDPAQTFRKGHGRLGGGARVVEVREVGSFTAFVLDASDRTALSQWLTDNDFSPTKSDERWLARYVSLNFFFVALRYNPQRPVVKGRAPSVKAETLRISFDTPLPYYPYSEPDPPAVVGELRLLDLWLVAPEPVVSVALRTMGEQRQWSRPFREGLVYEDARAKLEHILWPDLAALLPEGELVVQRLQDQKTSRRGFADVLFVPGEAGLLTQKDATRLTPLLPILDPRLRAEDAR